MNSLKLVELLLKTEMYQISSLYSLNAHTENHDLKIIGKYFLRTWH